jgi:hypothetical protein
MQQRRLEIAAVTHYVALDQLDASRPKRVG